MIKFNEQEFGNYVVLVLFNSYISKNTQDVNTQC